MKIVVVYDIKNSTAKDAARLRKVAKCCESWGTRVQNSVFECLVNADQYELMKNTLARLIDLSRDSLRFYRLGNRYDNRIETVGTTETVTERYIL